ncbi:MAG: aminotransferase class IV, partial [Deltaproteobacteria bacterium]|nr:aminotransferase class IV [Deltaproteobacteria bacterium]
HDTIGGPAVFRLDEHIDRLFRTAELLDMEIPIPNEVLHKAVLETVKRNGLKDGLIKIMGYYPQISAGIIPPQKRLDMTIFALDPKEDMGGMDFPFAEGTTVCVSKLRKLDPQTVPVEAKAAANYLNGMMARGEAAKRGYQDAVMLDTQGFIAEGGTESVFLVKDGTLMTPSPGTVLRSITRKSVLEVAWEMGIETFEGRLRPESLFEATEVFLSGTPMKVLPVRQVEDRTLADTPGPMTRQLFACFEDIVAGGNERFRDWLFLVN